MVYSKNKIKSFTGKINRVSFKTLPLLLSTTVLFSTAAQATDLRLPEPAQTSTAITPASSVHLAIPERLRQCPAVFEAPKQLARGELYYDMRVVTELYNELRIHNTRMKKPEQLTQELNLLVANQKFTLAEIVAVFYGNDFLDSQLSLARANRNQFDAQMSKYGSAKSLSLRIFLISDVLIVASAVEIMLLGSDTIAEEISADWRRILSDPELNKKVEDREHFYSKWTLDVKKQHDFLSAWRANLAEGRRSLEVPNREEIMQQKFPRDGRFVFNNDIEEIETLFKPMTAQELASAQFIAPTSHQAEFISQYDRILNDTLQSLISSFGKEQARIRDVTAKISNLQKQLQPAKGIAAFWQRLFKRQDNLDVAKIVNEIAALRNQIESAQKSTYHLDQRIRKVTELRASMLQWLETEQFAPGSQAEDSAQWLRSEEMVQGWKQPTLQFAEQFKQQQLTLSQAAQNVQSLANLLNMRQSLTLPSSRK